MNEKMTNLNQEMITEEKRKLLVACVDFSLRMVRNGYSFTGYQDDEMTPDEYAMTIERLVTLYDEPILAHRKLKIDLSKSIEQRFNKTMANYRRWHAIYDKLFNLSTSLPTPEYIRCLKRLRDIDRNLTLVFM
jgi:hypothetical protein